MYLAMLFTMMPRAKRCVYVIIADINKIFGRSRLSMSLKRQIGTFVDLNAYYTDF